MTQLQCRVLTFSPIVKGGGWVGVACFEGSLKLELSDSVLGVGEGALFPTPVGEGSLLVPAPLDVDVLPVAWCCLLLSRLGLALVLREYGEWGGLCFTGALGSKISPSEWRLGEVPRPSKQFSSLWRSKHRGLNYVAPLCKSPAISVVLLEWVPLTTTAHQNSAVVCGGASTEIWTVQHPYASPQQSLWYFWSEFH